MTRVGSRVEVRGRGDEFEGHRGTVVEGPDYFGRVGVRFDKIVNRRHGRHWIPADQLVEAGVLVTTSARSGKDDAG